MTATLERGAAIDRFTVLEQIGEGGMGVVVAAYDPTLDRKVAIKLLRPDRRALDDPGAARARLLKEAQAMARLSHPNVIHVYEVGTFGEEEVFVAMQFVDGGTLRARTEGRRRHWRDVLRLFVPAARGLAAAHAAGLVHRDFKPDNVLVGTDGKVCVTDFGLAAVSAASGAKGSSLLELSLTETGAIVGTPAYMAPEQHLAQPADARSDQYSFCVALFEALYFQRPFAQATLGELRAAVLEGNVSAPPASDVPAWVRRIVLRGLSRDPAARFPSMDELVLELGHDPAVTRRRRFVALGVLAVAATGGVLVFRGGEPACAGAAAHLAGAWDDGVRARVERAFAQSGRGTAAETFALVAGHLDTYTKAWTAMRTEACEATEVRHEQSAELLDRRMDCLDARLAELRGATAALVQPSAKTVDVAVAAVINLAPLSMCADARALLDAVPPPADPALRQRVAGLRLRMGVAKAWFDLLRPHPALAEAVAVSEEARQLGYAPLAAQALVVRGYLESLAGDDARSEREMREAIRVAAEVKDDLTVARGWTSLVYLAGRDRARHDEALLLEPVARAAIARAGGERRPLHDALVHRYVAHVLVSRGKLAEAERHIREALSLAAGFATERARLLRGLAGILTDELRPNEAVASLLEARRVFESIEGPSGETVEYISYELAYALQLMSRFTEAREHAERALAVAIRRLGAASPVLVRYHQMLAGVAAALKDGDAARTHYRRAVALLEGPQSDPVRMAHALATFGAGLVELGAPLEALEPLERARALGEAAGAGDELWSRLGLPLGHAYTAAGRLAEARAQLVRAAEIYEKKGERARVIMVLSQLAVVERKLGNPRAAVAAYERALEVGGGLKDVPHEEAHLKFGLAQALWEAGGARPRALALAREAAETYRATERDTDLAAVEAWLATR